MTAEIIDAAQDYIDKFTQAGVDRCRINHNAVSATECEECGEKLSDARWKAYPGCTMCVSCLNKKEIRMKITRGAEWQNKATGSV
ncbi:TPA: TraR/DksA C4-type zinc finger protein [Klebsiella oxytoca]|nr:TraR/DksA C4-type zinc finger protein [Klebsiella oxytoca]